MIMTIVSIICYSLLQKRSYDVLQETDYALEESRKEIIEENEVREEHDKRLLNRLQVNGCNRLKVPEDGNCLLAAVQLQLGKANMQTSVSQLRDIVSHHFIEHEDVYRQLTTYEEDYRSQCLLLKNDGYWNCQLFDLLPMVLSNATGARVRIYSSHITQSYTEIAPTAQIKPEVPISVPFINLAYTAIQGKEHYDAFERIKTDTQNESATEQAVVTSPIDSLIPVCNTVSSALPISSPTCLAECLEELNHSEAY